MGNASFGGDHECRACSCSCDDGLAAARYGDVYGGGSRPPEVSWQEEICQLEGEQEEDKFAVPKNGITEDGPANGFVKEKKAPEDDEDKIEEKCEIVRTSTNGAKRISIADELEAGVYDDIFPVPPTANAHAPWAAGEMDRPKTFSVRLNKEPTGSLGFVADSDDDDSLWVTCILSKGALKEWNDVHSERRVTIGDRILQVNNIAGDGPKHLKSMLETGDSVELSVQTHSRVTVEVIKNSPFALGIDVSPNTGLGRTLLITFVHDGALHRWNQSHRDTQVMQFDRILSVNGFEGPGKELHSRLKKTHGCIILVVLQHR